MGKKIGLTLGIIFLIIGILGFFGNPLVGEGGFFHADMVHNIVHLITGLIFVIVATKSESAMGTTLKIFGVIYLLVAIIGFFVVGDTGMGSVLGFIEVNGADNVLHLILGIIILAAGFMSGKKEMSMGGGNMGMNQ